jgi:hypothetical protein
MKETQMTSAPGWYPDPSSNGTRYFDGTSWTDQYRQPPTAQRRSEELDAAIARWVQLGSTVEFRSDKQAILIYKKIPSAGEQIAWAMATLFTCGLTAIPWIVVAVTRYGNWRVTLTVDDYGQIQESKAKARQMPRGFS